MPIRQQDVNSAMVSILKKLDTMVESTKDTYEQSLVVLGNIEAVMKNDVSTELKAQTKILANIEAKLSIREKDTLSSGNPILFNMMLGGFAKNLEKIIKAVSKIDDKAGDKISNFFNKLSESLAKFKKEVDKDSIKLLMSVAKGIAIFTLTMAGVAILAPIVLAGSVLISMSLGILALGLYVMGNKQVTQGVKSLLYASLGIVLFGLTILAFAATVDPISSVYVLLTVGLFGLAYYIIGENAKTIAKGALAMGLVSLSLVLLGLGLVIFKAANMTFEDAGILAVTIGGLALIMGLAGTQAMLIAEGSVAMIVSSIALILISAGLLVFKAANVTLEDAGILAGVIVGLGTTMALAGVVSPLIALGSGAMILAGVSLILVSAGLATFKAVGFTSADGDNLKGALSAVMSGFLGGDAPGGFVANLKFAAKAAERAALLLITVPPMILAGMALIAISGGLAAFKSIGFSQSDSDNMQYAIGSVVKAFSIVTDKDLQKKFGININWKDFSVGIFALSGAGSTLASLASGIQSWANLEVTEWEVINGGTSKAQLVVKNKRKMNDADFTSAGQNIAKVISAIAEPFAKVGKLNQGQSSGDPLYDAIFGNTYVADGIKSLKNSGDTLVNLAKGIQAFANLEITEYEVINAGTKDAKIVPKSTRKMSEGDFTAASANIGMIIGFLAKELAKIGEMEDNSSGWFSNGYVKKGQEAIANLGGNISSMAEAIVKLANSEITEYKVDSNGKLIPVSTRKLNSTDYVNAANNLKTIMSIIVDGVANVGLMVEQNGAAIKSGSDAIPNLTKALSSAADSVSKWSQLKDVEKTGESIKTFLSQINSIFSPTTSPDIAQSTQYFSVFSNNLKTMASSADQFTKIADNFDRMQKSMKLFKDSVNAFDIKKLSTTDSLMKSLAIMSKSPDALGAKISDSIEKAFKELTDSLKELIGEQKTESQATTAALNNFSLMPVPATTQVAATPTPMRNEPPQPPVPSITKADIQAAFIAALQTVTIKTKEQTI